MPAGQVTRSRGHWDTGTTPPAAPYSCLDPHGPSCGCQRLPTSVHVHHGPLGPQMPWQLVALCPVNPEPCPGQQAVRWPEAPGLWVPPRPVSPGSSGFDESVKPQHLSGGGRGGEEPGVETGAPWTHPGKIDLSLKGPAKDMTGLPFSANPGPLGPAPLIPTKGNRSLINSRI